MSINNLKEFRQQYPEYNDVSDENVMRTLHAEYYSDFPYEDFDKVFRGQEEQSILRQVADVPLGIASGAVSGVRGITDVFGAQNVLSSALGDVQEYIDSLKSAQSRQDQEEINRILSEAEDKGILDQVKAGFQAFTVAPIDFLSQAAGTALPIIAGGTLGAATRLGAAGTQAALGAGMGAGFIKGGIYDTVKNELIESGLSEEQADVAAMEAQSYGGENLDSILLAGIIGGVAGSTGLEKVAANRIMGKLAAQEGAKGAIARATQTAAVEAGTEMVQAGQEQFAQNLALKREGFDVPLSRGVYSAAIMEGLAGGILGGGAGAITPVQREGLSEEAAREREAQLRQREERDRVKFLTALNAKAMEAENNATIVKQLDEAIDAEQDPEVRAGLIEERDIYAQFAETGEPKVPPVTPAVIPPPQEPIEDVVEFGRRYAANISDTLGDAFPSIGKFTIQQSSVVDTNAGPVDTSSIEAQLTSEQLRNARPVFSVVDPDGNRYGVPLDRPDQANAFAGALNEEVFNTGIRGEIENILDNAEQAYTPEVADTLFTYGWRVLNPTNSGFSFIDVNRAAGTTADKGYLEGLSFRDVEAGTKKRDGSVDIELPDGRVVNTTGLTVGQKINKKRVENGLPETQVFTVQEVRDELGEGFEGLQISGVQPAPGDSKAQIKRLLEEKNIVTDLAAPEFETLVRSFTGRSKFKDLTKGEANVLYQRLSALPRFNEKTKLPDFTPKPYTRTQFKQASKLIQDANTRGQKVSDQELASELGIDPKDPRRQERLSALKKDLGKQGVEPKPILALPAPTGDSINDLRDAIERELRGFGLEGIGLNLNQTLMLPNGQAAQQDTEGFFSPFQRLIFLAVDRVDPRGELTPEQRLSALSEIMNHEVVHAARMLDLWTQSEWSNLENASARLIKPGTNKTYLQVAKESYPDYTPAMVVEEAVAELAREYSKNRKVVSGRPQSLLNRLFKLFEKLKSAIKGTGFQTYEEVLESFQRGDIGRRARGEIRTLRASEAESTAVPERLRPLMGTTPRAPRPRPAAGAPRPTTETPRPTADFDVSRLGEAAVLESRRNPQVDTPEFKKWFGDSKIVDENGDPLVVYHGTNVDFDYFKIGREGGALGNGIYLGADPDFVANYADQEGGRLIPVYASIKNPLITRTVSGQLSDPMVDALIQLGVTEDKAYSITEKAYDKKGYITTEVQKRAVEKGFDGIVQYKNGKLSEIVAFSPRQIKSAISNVGSFDPYSKFIRESRRSPNELPTPYQRKPVKTPSKATAKDVEMANEYKDRTNFDPYLSDGQITAPIANLRFSVKAPYQEKDLAKGKENHPILGLPLNKNGTVTLYYPATNEAARKVNQDKRLKGATPTSNRIYLTNESSGPKVMQNPGNIDQPMDGANVLIQVDPSLLHLDQEYEDGRKDFFIQLAEGDAYAKKMKMTKLFTLDAPRTRALSQNTKLVDIERSITNSIANYLSLNQKDRRAALKRAKDILKKEHNVGTLMGENGKLQKTRVGDYGLTYDGKSVASMGLGLASAQRINEQNLSTCPKSAICEGLCLGETSGQNLLYGGEGQFKSGPRLSQYLKTEAIVQHPEEFAIALYEEISKFRRWSLSESGVEQVENEAGEKVTQPKQVYQPAIRLNVTSDFRPQTFASIINAFPDVMFYDYTKLPTKSIAPNHHLTYSSTGASQYVNGETVINPESNWDKMVERLNAGNNVAMAFTSRTDMPEFVVDEKTGQRFQVWDGDNYDARFLDPKREDGIGMIIGLTNKDKTTKPEEAAKKYKGFFLNYDKARDGDTLVIPNQRGMSIGPVEPPVIRESRNPALLEQAREKAVQEAKQVPVGAVPYLNANASPEALYVAQNPVAGEPLTPDMRLRYSRSNQPDYDPEDRELIEKMTGMDQPPNKTPGETYLESLTTKQKIRYVWDSIRKEVFFNYSRLEYLVKTDPRLIGNLGDVSSLAAVEFQDRAFALAAEAYARGVPVYEGGITKIVDFNFNGKKYQGLLGVMDPIFNNQYGNLEKAAQSYAVAKRSLRLIREGKQAPGFDKSKTLEENIRNAKENFRKAEEMADKFVNPETGESIIREWNDVWAAYNENIIKYLRDTGILDNETAELWRNQADYVPFYRVEKDGTINAHPKVFGGLTSTTQLKAVGRSSEEITGNMLESITTNLGAAIAMGMKNVAQQRIVRDMITVELGRMLSKGESTKDKMVVTFKVQGKKYQAEIFDPLIFESMQAIPNLDWIDGVMGSILTAPAQFLRQMIVRDPAYMLANTIRDTVANSVTSGSNYIPVVDTFRNLNSGFENLRKYGIVAGIDFSKDPKSLIENMAEEAARRGMRLPDEYTGRLSKIKRSSYVKPLLLAWDILGDVSAKSEAATRNAVYEDVLARSGNEGEAAYQAMSVINYGRRGRNKAIQFITATVPFFNARLQGLDIIGRSARGFYSARSERSRRRNMISFAARALTMTALTGIYYTLVSDDEEYQSQTEDIKDNYYILPVIKGDLEKGERGFAFKVPIPFEVGVLFKLVPERILRAYNEETDQRALKQSLTKATLNTLGLNPIPQAVKPLIEIATNYDFYTGQPIVPTYMEMHMDPMYRSRFGTNQVAKILGEKIQVISPLKIDHLLNGYTGTLGMYTLQVIDELLREGSTEYPARRPTEYPFVRRFLADNYGKGLQDQFYDMSDKILEATGSINQLIKDGRIDELQAHMTRRASLIALKDANQSIRNVMQDYRQQRTMILTSEMDEDTKRQMIDELDRHIALTLRIVPELRQRAFGPDKD